MALASNHITVFPTVVMTLKGNMYYHEQTCEIPLSLGDQASIQRWTLLTEGMGDPEMTFCLFFTL